MPDDVPKRVQDLVDHALGELNPQQPDTDSPTQNADNENPGSTDLTASMDLVSGAHRPEYQPQLRDGSDPRPLLVMGVTTWNRQEYLQRFVESFDSTRSRQFRWVLVIADDGSTDGTLEYARSVALKDCAVVIVENKRATIAGQANSIIRAAVALGFDFAFKCDDDVFFVAEGWDIAYFNTAKETGFAHLVYHNQDWKAPLHDLTARGLRSAVEARDTMGCFYTFSPSVVEAVGYMDEVNFPFRGHSHIDYTVRACRAGFNEEKNVWDIEDSTRFVEMWKRSEYIELVDWNSQEVRTKLGPEERARRMELIDLPGRLYVPPVSQDPSLPSPILRVGVEPTGIMARLIGQGVGRQPRGTSAWFDSAYVLNLAIDSQKWAETAGTLSRHSVDFRRFPAIDGGTETNVDEWRSYAASGLTSAIERQINRKLIQSTGAWGYLKTMEKVILDATDRRLGSFLAFDDDVMLHKDFAERLDGVMESLPTNWKILYLGNSQVDWDVVDKVDDKFYHPRGEANGSFAFALRHSAYAQALSSIRRFDRPFDSGALREIDHADPRSVFALWEPLAIADVTTSSIRLPRDMTEYAATFGWDLAAYDDRESTDRGLVTVMIIAHNDEEHLERTLASLRHQTYPHIEILCVDNASSDRTGLVISSAKRADTRVRYLATTKREKRSDLLNTVLRRARGRRFFVHDADELSAPDRLEYLTAVAAASQESIATRGHVADVSSAYEGARTRSSYGSDLDPTSDGMIRSGLVSVEAVLSLGGLLEDSESGFQEFCTRYELALRTKQDGSLVTAVSVPGAARRPVAFRPQRADGTALEYDLFHQEIAAGVRSPRIPQPPPIAITEFN